MYVCTWNTKYQNPHDLPVRSDISVREDLVRIWIYRILLRMIAGRNGILFWNRLFNARFFVFAHCCLPSMLKIYKNKSGTPKGKYAKLISISSFRLAVHYEISIFIMHLFFVSCEGGFVNTFAT